MTLLVTVVGVGTPWREAIETSPPTLRRSEDVPLRSASPRPVYAHAIVPDGVYSADDVRAAIARDPVVAAHYRDLDAGDLRATTLTASRAAYVSYRIGDHVYWTGRPVWIQAGETVLTDGARTVRARCGNVLSATRQEPVAAVEPARGVLDDAIVPPSDRGVDAFAADAEPGLTELLSVPFGPEALAFVAPDTLPPALETNSPFGGRPFPFLSFPAAAFPGSSSSGDGTGAPGASPQPGPSVSPAPFVPVPGGPPGTSTGAPGTGSAGSTMGRTGDATDTTGFATTGPTDTATTAGVPTRYATTTGDASTLTTSGSTDSGRVATTGATRAGDSSGAASTPEPDVWWLLACGLVALARRHVARTK